LQAWPEANLDDLAVQIADMDANPIDLKLLRQMVVDAIAQLSEQDQEIIQLRSFEDLSARDVAERLRISEGAVNKRFHDAKQRLRKILGPRGDI
jgi:RNA polymerase sigma factor (sigma-70 family)